MHRRADPRSAAGAARLPATTRPHLHALAGFAAHLRSLPTAEARVLVDELEGGCAAGTSPTLVLRAVVLTHLAFGLDPGLWRPLAAAGPRWGEADARAVGALCTPVLEPAAPAAHPHLLDLAAAAHLTARLEAGDAPGRTDLVVARARRLLVSADLAVPLLPTRSAQALRTHRHLLALALTGVAGGTRHAIAPTRLREATQALRTRARAR